jgi:hypothetical protein
MYIVCRLPQATVVVRWCRSDALSDVCIFVTWLPCIRVTAAAVAVSAERSLLTFIERMPDARIQAHDVYVGADDRSARWREHLASATVGSSLLAVRALLDAPLPASSLEQEYALFVAQQRKV